MRLDRLVGGRQSEYLLSLQRAGREIRVRINRRRRKTLALYVEKGKMTELRAPTNCAWRDIHEFLESRFDWILDAEQELAHRKTTPADSYGQGGEICYLGSRYPLELVRSHYRVVGLQDEKLLVSCSQPDNEARVRELVLDWYRRQAEALTPGRMKLLNRCFDDDIRLTGLVHRKMKARWGSCSSQGEICLNLLLIREDLPQIDFVIAHELCHLRHFAHNAEFYGLLGQVMPDWREREARLGNAG